MASEPNPVETPYAGSSERGERGHDRGAALHRRARIRTDDHRGRPPRATATTSAGDAPSGVSSTTSRFPISRRHDTRSS